MMSIDALLTLIILIATLAVLMTQRLRADLTALLVMVALILTGVLEAGQVFSAFGQPVIIIIPSIYVLGAAMYDTGVAAIIAHQIQRFSRQGPVVLMLVVMIISALLSAVLSSLLVIAVLMPALLRIARQEKIAPAQLLLPMALAATMGNLLTLIGAVSNLVVSDTLAVSGQPPLDLLSLTPYGLVSVGITVLWFVVVGRRLLSQELPTEEEPPSLDEVERNYRLGEMLYRLRVRSGSDLSGKRLADCDLGQQFHINVMAVKPKGGQLRRAHPELALEQDDLLIVEGPRGNILQAATRHHLEPKGTLPLDEFNQIEEETLRLAEVMVPFRSRWVGRSLAETRFRERYGLNILGVHRYGRAIREDLPQVTLAAGDTLLVQGPLAYLRRVGRDRNLVLATHLGPQPGDLITSKAGLTLLILGLMLVGVVSGLMSLATASLTAAVALVATNCIDLGRAYRSIDGSILILIGGMLPLARALDVTGVAELIAGQIAAFNQILGAGGTLLLLYLFTAVLTQIISNSVAAALMVPIAVNLATAQGVAPEPFVIAIAISVTVSYVTPFTNGDMLLIRDPGRYTTRDYVINGLPIFIFQTIALMLMLLLNS